MTRTIVFLLAANIATFIGLVSSPASFAQTLNIVPAPRQVQVSHDLPGLRLGEDIAYHLSDRDPDLLNHIESIAAPLDRLTGRTLKIVDKQSEAQLVFLIANHPPNSYSLTVTQDAITIRASRAKDFAHATATLLQIFGQYSGQPIPPMQIAEDGPDCNYRSVMIDLGRNPHSLECLKETVDMLWFYKLDSLHLHLTDDQRFAFPSKAFPKLVTEQGLITWQEFEELERYAHAKGITLIPELDVPGHSTILRREYPDVFGKSPTELAKNEASRSGIKTLLDEMIELFPSSPYVHIGGDEAYGVDQNLQREFINELHDHLNSKGKGTIVWEGPSRGQGENAVHKDVIHINWRTIEFPADQMLEAGHKVVNAAWDPLYVVDHYPRNNFTMASPEHIYNKLDLPRFAHFNPGIPTFSKPLIVEPNDNLIGFCMPWWEGREVNYLPLMVPRVIPLAEVAWNTKRREYNEFAKRAAATETIRKRCFYPATISARNLVLESESVFHNTTQVEIESNTKGRIRFTLDGSQPKSSSPIYVSPIDLDRSAVIRAAVYVDGRQIGHGSRRTFVQVVPQENLALGKPVETSVTSGPLHTPARLTDGGTGNLDFYLGYPAEPEPIEITIDLERSTSINRIVTHSCFNGNSFESYTLEVSTDGKEYVQVADRQEKPEELSAVATHKFETINARYIRIKTNGCKNMVFDAFSKFTEIQVFSD